MNLESKEFQLGWEGFEYWQELWKRKVKISREGLAVKSFVEVDLRMVELLAPGAINFSL